MKKTLKYILITSIMMFIGMNNGFAKTCKYIYTGDGTAKTEFTATIDDNGNINVTLQTFKNESYNDKKLLVREWDFYKQKYLEKKTCPSYGLVHSSNGLLDGNSYTVTLAYDKAELEGLYKSLYKEKNVVIIPNNEISKDDLDPTKVRNCQAYLSDALNYAQNVSSQKLTTDTCRDTDGTKKYTAYKECTESAKSSLSTLKTFYNEINDCVGNGYLSNDDKDVKNFYSYYKSADSNLTKYKENVEKERDAFINDGTVKTDDEIGELNGCADMPNTISLLKQVYSFIKYLIPVLIIVLSIIDFIKVVANGDDKEYKNAWNKFIKRIIVGIIILIVPQLISAIISLTGIDKAYGINDIICILK